MVSAQFIQEHTHFVDTVNSISFSNEGNNHGFVNVNFMTIVTHQPFMNSISDRSTLQSKKMLDTISN